MATEQELSQKIEKGYRYKQLWDNPTFKELVDGLGSNAFHEWNTSEINDFEKQRIAKHDLEAGKRVLAYCKSYINDGDIAQKELLKLQEQDKNKK